MLKSPDFTDSVLFEKLIEEPQLCMLLNRELSTAQLAALADTFFVVDVEHEGETYFSVVCGHYRKPIDEDVKPKLVDPWGHISKAQRDSDAE